MAQPIVKTSSGLDMSDLLFIALVTGHGAAFWAFGLWAFFAAAVCGLIWAACYGLWKFVQAVPSILESLESGFNALISSSVKWIPLLFNRSVDALAHVLSL